MPARDSTGVKVIINQSRVVECPRQARLTGVQRRFLDEMDADMERGIVIEGQEIRPPNALQRAHYVALQLVEALEKDNPALVQATCAYLNTRQPALTGIRARVTPQEIHLDLEFEHGRCAAVQTQDSS